MNELLEGSIVVPFPYVAAGVGLIVLVTLLYFARRMSDEE